MSRKPKHPDDEVDEVDEVEVETPAVLANLIEQLPAQGAIWPEADRRTWLLAMEANFRVMYKSDVAPLAPRKPPAFPKRWARDVNNPSRSLRPIGKR